MIKNLGIFSDFSCEPNLHDFKRYNVIYGWNGSGKTTLSQLCSSLETGKSTRFPELEYKIETSEGLFNEKIPFTKKVRVFNQDYIAENIDITSCRAKPIYILGKENKDLAEAIKADEKLLYGDPDKKGDIGKIKEAELKRKEIGQKETEKGKLFTGVAKVISINTSGVSARNYRKNNAEQAFSKLEEKKTLSEEEIISHSIILKQQVKPNIEELKIDDINKEIERIVEDARVILERTVEVVTIDRLKENPDISEWVEHGLTLHTAKNSINCEFCNRPLPSERIKDLFAFFNDADKRIKNDIDCLIARTVQVYNRINEIQIPDKANLYDDLQQAYIIETDALVDCKKRFLDSISSLLGEIKEKKSKTSDVIELKSFIDTNPLMTSVSRVNSLIKSHNSKTVNFDREKNEAQSRLENHYLSEIYDEVKKLESEIEDISHELDQIENGDPSNQSNIGINKLQERIRINKEKMSTSGKACNEINKQLATFLGRNELIFEVADEGYLLKRKGRIAKNLSEGEKTAIAFVYFTIHLKDQDFNIEDGIVVIDDPISSLDSNSMFQAFAFLKNTVKDCKQVFIMTHSFDFLRLLLGWLKHKKVESPSELYMIKNIYLDGARSAIIDNLDKLLVDYETEYHYLAKILFELEHDGTIASVYHIPNIARKVLEYFLTIMVPNNENNFNKLARLKFDENKKTAIYKFTNEQSHITGKGFDPSIVQECQNCVKYLLEMIEELFPEHYKILVESMSIRGAANEQNNRDPNRKVRHRAS